LVAICNAKSAHKRFVCPTWAVTKTAHVIKKRRILQDYIFSPRKMNDFSSGGKMLSQRNFLAGFAFLLSPPGAFLHSPLSASAKSSKAKG
jgi:hypothetical protein